MPRPRKPRRCSGRSRGHAFKPTGAPMSSLEQIGLAGDEPESLRLRDQLGLTREEAGRRMGVSRGTAQRIVKGARSKAAKALLEGAALILEPDLDQDRNATE